MITFIDVETSGLNPQAHDILAIAALRCTDDLDIVGSLNVRVLPITDMSNAEPRALEVNGYKPERWIGALPLVTALEAMRSMVNYDGVVAGHNIKFDLSFIDVATSTTGMCWNHDHHTIDTVSFSWLAMKWGLAKSVGRHRRPASEGHMTQGDVQMSKIETIELMGWTLARVDDTNEVRIHDLELGKRAGLSRPTRWLPPSGPAPPRAPPASASGSVPTKPRHPLELLRIQTLATPLSECKT